MNEIKLFKENSRWPPNLSLRSSSMPTELKFQVWLRLGANWVRNKLSRVGVGAGLIENKANSVQFAN
jgi:hypothetical protein